MVGRERVVGDGVMEQVVYFWGGHFDGGKVAIGVALYYRLISVICK